LTEQGEGCKEKRFTQRRKGNENKHFSLIPVLIIGVQIIKIEKKRMLVPDP